MRKPPSHDMEEPSRRLPVTLAPRPDELLSSWIGRHAEFYGIPPLAMLRHCLPEASSLRTADLNLNENQVFRLARMLCADPTTIRHTTSANVAQSSRCLMRKRLYSHAQPVILQSQNRDSFFEISFSAGVSLVLFAAVCSGIPVGVTVPLPSATTMRLLS